MDYEKLYPNVIKELEMLRKQWIQMLIDGNLNDFEILRMSTKLRMDCNRKELIQWLKSSEEN